MTEFIRMFIAQELLNEVKQRLIQASHPHQIILFGSYAQGMNHSHSDLDILVIENSIASRIKEMIRLRRVLRGLKVPIDLLVISQKEFEERSQVPSTVYYWAKKEGKILYDSTK